MLWEIVYSIVFFLLPLLGMSVIVGVKSCKKEQVVAEECLDIEEVIDVSDKVVLKKDFKFPCLPKNKRGVIIDLDTYREFRIIRGWQMCGLKRSIYARDGPGDTS